MHHQTISLDLAGAADLEVTEDRIDESLYAVGAAAEGLPAQRAGMTRRVVTR
jgi:hypothetical protein